MTSRPPIELPQSDLRIWKWQVPFGRIGKPDSAVHDMPVGATIVGADLLRDGTDRVMSLQDGSRVFELWAAVNPDAEKTPRTFLVVGTGHPLPEATLAHVAVVRDGIFVWHLLEVLSS